MSLYLFSSRYYIILIKVSKESTEFSSL